MGFITYNEEYYRRRLAALEGAPLSDADVYEVRQLLKVLDDLADEGYTELNRRMEDDFSCLSRLRGLLARAGAAPFPMENRRIGEAAYGEAAYELGALIDRFIAESESAEGAAEGSFLPSIRRYSQWIEYRADTAYVFLLRDALLPYVYARRRHPQNVYPWLISRRFLADVSGVPDIDDAIRLPIYAALEAGRTEYSDFCACCRAGILAALEAQPALTRALSALLDSIPEKKIMVIESGYAGTMPMLLKALDARVDFRLYTTAPYLYETYRDRIFCRRYEDVRRFETICSHDMLLRYAEFRNGRFYVNLSENPAVAAESRREIKLFLP